MKKTVKFRCGACAPFRPLQRSLEVLVLLLYPWGAIGIAAGGPFSSCLGVWPCGTTRPLGDL